MIIGIDLGTTNSLVGIYRATDSEGKAQQAIELIANGLGHRLTPSVVSLDDQGQVLVGLPARERLMTHPSHSAMAFKRWMGSTQQLMLGNRSFRAEELSSFVLRALKADAESHLGTSITQAVITVPAYFNEAQRKATKAAAEMAELKPLRLLNEPTAAGLAYGLDQCPDHTHFLVFDLGGGTFDVSVLEYFDKIVQVRASAGDTRLGGEDFTAVLAEMIDEQLTDLPPNDRQYIRQSRQLWRAAEQAKRDLGDRETANFTLLLHLSPESADGPSAQRSVTLSREEFEKRCESLLLRLRRPIERALSDARLRLDELDEVVLVGGATRMPMIRHLVSRLFMRLPLRSVDPDEAIVRGAAIQAGLCARDAALHEVILTDVMPYTLGVVVQKTVNGRHFPDCYSPIIERNTPVPVSREQSYTTVDDFQTKIALSIRQGESPVGSENIELGLLEVPVPRTKAGEVTVQVRLSYDISGLLEVDACEQNTGRVVSTKISQSGQTLDEAAIEAARNRLAKLKIHPREEQVNLYAIERAKRLYADTLGETRELIAMNLAHFRAALESQDPSRIHARRGELNRILDAIDSGFTL